MVNIDYWGKTGLEFYCAVSRFSYIKRNVKSEDVPRQNKKTKQSYTNHFHDCLLMKNEGIISQSTAQCSDKSRWGKEDLTKFKLYIRVQKKRDLVDIERVSETAALRASRTKYLSCSYDP